MSEVFLHVGFGQSASTFLQGQFDEHIEIDHITPQSTVFQGVVDSLLAEDGKSVEWTVSRKVPSLSHRVQVMSRENCLGFFPISRKRRHRVKQYNLKRFQTRVAEMLEREYPGAKILLITRSPSEAVKSSYSQYIKYCGVASLGEFVRRNTWFFDHIYDYDFVYQLYAEKFGQDSILILPYEMLVDEPNRFLSSISDYLGLSYPIGINLEKSNSRYSDEQLRAMRSISVMMDLMTKNLPAESREVLFSHIPGIFSRIPQGRARRILDRIGLSIGDKGVGSLNIKSKCEVIKTLPMFEYYSDHY